jgi:hypothetical protein
VDEEEIIDEADVEPIEENPYKDVKLEGLRNYIAQFNHSN